MVTSRVYDSLDRADKRAYVRLLLSAPSLPASAGLSHALIFLSVLGARGARLAFESTRLRDVCFSARA